jgi:hypothetical protein
MSKTKTALLAIAEADPFISSVSKDSCLVRHTDYMTMIPSEHTNLPTRMLDCDESLRRMDGNYGRSSMDSSLQRPTLSPEEEQVETVKGLSDNNEEYSTVKYKRADGSTVERTLPEPCDDDIDEADPLCPRLGAVARMSQDVFDGIDRSCILATAARLS